MNYDAMQRLRVKIFALAYAAKECSISADEFKAGLNNIKKSVTRPHCPNCKKLTSPAGGTLDGKESYWACWTCGYEVRDIQFEEIKDTKLIHSPKP